MPISLSLSLLPSVTVVDVLVAICAGHMVTSPDPIFVPVCPHNDTHKFAALITANHAIRSAEDPICNASCVCVLTSIWRRRAAVLCRSGERQSCRVDPVAGAAVARAATH